MRRLWGVVERQPVRVYLYGVLGAGETLAVAYGLVSANRGALWLALGAAVLVVPGVELARSKVTPVADPRDAAGERLWSFRDLPPRGRRSMPPLYDFRSRPPHP